MKVEHVSDEALMEQFQRGSVRAFEQLVERHERPMFNFLCRQVGNESLAEDLFQEVFLRLCNAARTYRQEAKVTTFMYTIARNLCVDHARRAKHRDMGSLDESGRFERVADRGPSVDRRAMGKQLQNQLARAVESLGPDQREVFLMRELSNLRFKEIAEIIGCSENTAKSRMRYALDHLRRELEDFRDLAEAIR